MTTADHKTKALQALGAVESLFDLDVWHDTFLSSESYLLMSDEDAAALEEIYQSRRGKMIRHEFPIFAG